MQNTGAADDFEHFLQSKFEPLVGKTLEIRPCTVADRHGQLLLWYLPGIFTPRRHVCERAFTSAEAQRLIYLGIDV